MSANTVSGVDMAAGHARQVRAHDVESEELSWKELTDLFTKQTGAINALWQNYSAVAGVMLVGAGAATVAHPLTWRPKLALSLAFGMFSQGNFVLLRQACRIHVRLAAAISGKLAAHDSTLAPPYSDMLRTVASTANSPTWMMLYHFTIDTCVLVAIWLSSVIIG